MENKKNKNQEKQKKEEEKLPYDTNINSDDEQALHDKNLSMNQNQDKPLAEREDVDFTGKNLDIPGRNESDTSDEGTDIPDEENLQFNERGKRPKMDKNEEHPDPDSFNP